MSSASEPVGSPLRLSHAESRCTGSTCESHGREAARESRERRRRRHDRRLLHEDNGGSFALAYVVYNTIMNLTTQAAQGVLPKRCGAPRAGWPVRRRGHGSGAASATPARSSRLRRWEGPLGIDECDAANQALISHHLEEVDGTIERPSFPFRYVWPADLDPMSQLAGMTLRERWGAWRHGPFMSDSRTHVSVWQKSTRDGDGGLLQ